MRPSVPKDVVRSAVNECDGKSLVPLTQANSYLQVLSIETLKRRFLNLLTAFFPTRERLMKMVLEDGRSVVGGPSDVHYIFANKCDISDIATRTLQIYTPRDEFFDTTTTMDG